VITPVVIARVGRAAKIAKVAKQTRRNPQQPVRPTLNPAGVKESSESPRPP
jgi:hypothetical protein